MLTMRVDMGMDMWGWVWCSRSRGGCRGGRNKSVGFEGDDVEGENEVVGVVDVVVECLLQEEGGREGGRKEGIIPALSG